MYKKNYYTLKSELISKNSERLSYDIYYPKIVCPEKPAITTINNFSRFDAEEFKKYIEEKISVKIEKQTEKIKILSVFQQMFASRFIISFKYDVVSVNEKIEKIRYIRGATFNTFTGSHIRFKDFFRDNVRYKEMILYIICSKIKEKNISGLYKDWQARVYAGINLDNFYICKEGFVIYLDGGILTPEHCMGNEILISFMELKNQLKTELLKI